MFYRGHAIKIRQEDAVGGFFSQIGDLYQVHHIWGTSLYIVRLIFSIIFEKFMHSFISCHFKMIYPGSKSSIDTGFQLTLEKSTYRIDKIICYKISSKVNAIDQQIRRKRKMNMQMHVNYANYVHRNFCFLS